MRRVKQGKASRRGHCDQDRGGSRRIVIIALRVPQIVREMLAGEGD